VGQLRAATEDQLGSAGGSRPQRRFHNDGAIWRRDDRFARACLRSPLPKIAAAPLGARRLVLCLLDELFVKEPQMSMRTP
jgi:hypothetical protein